MYDMQQPQSTAQQLERLQDIQYSMKNVERNDIFIKSSLSTSIASKSSSSTSKRRRKSRHHDVSITEEDRLEAIKLLDKSEFRLKQELKRRLDARIDKVQRRTLML